MVDELSAKGVIYDGSNAIMWEDVTAIRANGRDTDVAHGGQVWTVGISFKVMCQALVEFRSQYHDPFESDVERVERVTGDQMQIPD